MTERYWITGAQLGVLKASLTRCRLCRQSNREIVKTIEDDQFIGRMSEPYDNYEVVIKKKV